MHSHIELFAYSLTYAFVQGDYTHCTPSLLAGNSSGCTQESPIKDPQNIGTA